MRTTATLAVAVVAGALGIAAYTWQSASRHERAHDEQVLWSQRLKGIDGSEHRLAEWRGKTLVVNFWATWCEPCREEIPMFVKLQQEYAARGVQFVGVAIDEPHKVAAFVRDFRINYPVVTGGLDAAEWSRQLGNENGALPYTLLIAPDGTVRLRHLGALTRQALVPELERIL